MTTLAKDLVPVRTARLRPPIGIAAGGGMLLALLAASALAPVLSGYDPIAQNLNAMLLAPSAAHWFGTDNYAGTCSRGCCTARRSTSASGFWR